MLLGNDAFEGGRGLRGSEADATRSCVCSGVSCQSDSSTVSPPDHHDSICSPSPHSSWVATAMMDKTNASHNLTRPGKCEDACRDEHSPPQSSTIEEIVSGCERHLRRRVFASGLSHLNSRITDGMALVEQCGQFFVSRAGCAVYHSIYSGPIAFHQSTQLHWLATGI
jgi:hypothetical protein